MQVASSAKQPQKDLIVLVPDIDIQATLRGLLNRKQAFGMREIQFDIFRHLNRDPGCFREGEKFLRPFSNKYQHALVVFDFHGSGGKSLSQVESNLESRLSASGWKNRAKVVVIDPELEAWVWSDSPEVEKILGWSGQNPDLRTWLQSKNLFPKGAWKPGKPKDALEQALRHVGKAKSSANFSELGSRVSFKGCKDPSFNKLRTILTTWFQTPSRD